MLIYSKLKSARRLLSLSQSEIESEVGLSQRDISQLENGKKKFIPTEYIQYLNKIGVDLDSLFDDEFSLELFQKRLSDKLSKTLSDLDSVSPKSGKTTSTENSKNEVCPAPFFVSDSGKTNSTNIIELPVPVGDDSATVSIPLVEISVAAGSGFYNPDYLSEIDCIRMPRSMIKGGQPHICVRIKGESMVPTLQDGGYLVIRLLDRSEWRDVRDGHVYVVSSTEGRAFVKRLKNRFKEFGFIVCMSDNPDPMGYPNFNLMENEINTIWHAEWYISAKMPNIHATYYKKVDEMGDAIEEMRSMFTNELQQVRREIRTLSK